MKTCAVDGCVASTRRPASELCEKHYARLRLTGTTDDPAPRARTVCSVADCDRLSVANGLCGGHYQRVQVHGDPLADRPFRSQHGHATGDLSPTYQSWRAMLDRCLRPSNKAYRYYGGRGVAVCEGWMQFANFLEDMGERPDGLTLDRIDPEGNYEPGNCRWATRAEQARNQRRWVAAA